MKTKLAFAKVKRINDDVNELFFNIEGALYSSMEGLAAYERMDCAKKLFWINENFFYDDVPVEDVSMDEFQTEEGQKKYWNKYLTDLKAEWENGSIIDYIPAQDDFSPDECQICYVLDVGGREFFFMDETTIHGSDIYELFETENVTSEYFDKLVQTINVNEIKEFVDTHTQEEVEEKYTIKWFKEHNESMWEL